MKLTQDQKERLQGFERDDWDAINAYCQAVLASMARQVLGTDDPKKMVREKFKYDGAQALATEINAARVALKEKKNG